MKLTAKARKKLPNSVFAGPGRSYPVEDRSHAANAKARASQQVKAGNLSEGQKSHIDAMANRILHKIRNG
jgi:translation elongation factor P/translation initiation factor 5A